jgi:uncharacterized protein YndB with AHSA1/START domain
VQEDGAVVRTTVMIAASIERVWDILTDLDRYELWHPSMELIDLPRGDELAPGTILHLRTNRGKPTEVAFDVTVTEVTKPSVLAWEGGEPQVFFGRHRWVLTTEGEGTRLLDEEAFTGAMAAAVLTEHRETLQATYAASGMALKAAAEHR